MFVIRDVQWNRCVYSVCVVCGGIDVCIPSPTIIRILQSLLRSLIKGVDTTTVNRKIKNSSHIKVKQ